MRRGITENTAPLSCGNCLSLTTETQAVVNPAQIYRPRTRIARRCSGVVTRFPHRRHPRDKGEACGRAEFATRRLSRPEWEVSPAVGRMFALVRKTVTLSQRRRAEFDPTKHQMGLNLPVAVGTRILSTAARARRHNAVKDCFRSFGTQHSRMVIEMRLPTINVLRKNSLIV